MRERLMRFMQGRCGNDQLNIFLMLASLVCLVLSAIFGGVVGTVFRVLLLVLLGLAYYRMLSRNICRRSEENGKYMRLKYKVRARLHLYYERWVQRKDYKFFSCPECKSTLRVPRGKGKINIVCRKCGNSFTGKT